MNTAPSALSVSAEVSAPTAQMQVFLASQRILDLRNREILAARWRSQLRPGSPELLRGLRLVAENGELRFHSVAGVRAAALAGVAAAR